MMTASPLAHSLPCARMLLPTLLWLLLSAQLGGASSASAESPATSQPAGRPEMVVTSADSHEVQRLTLGRNQGADITVHLASLGDMVSDCLVTLRRDTDNKRILSLLSDRHGIVVFEDVPPGSYRVEVVRQIKDDGELNSVLVGDVRLSPASSSAAGRKGRFPQ